ncbi:unnamed protein product [Amoebophrya sp. A120]|nr:unnamed protein product [Amoebophrya sp. A120]|eukprot:GSA120T00010344001.1
MSATSMVLSSTTPSLSSAASRMVGLVSSAGCRAEARHFSAAGRRHGNRSSPLYVNSPADSSTTTTTRLVLGGVGASTSSVAYPHPGRGTSFPSSSSTAPYLSTYSSNTPSSSSTRSSPFHHTSQRRCIAVIAEPTPNPESIMFYPQAQDVLGKAAKTKTFQDKATARSSLLATALFKVHGVAQVMLAARHVTITKQPDIDWDFVRPNIELVMSQFFAAGLEVIDPQEIDYYQDGQSRMPNPVADGVDVPEKPDGSSENFEQELLQLLEERVQPFVQQDGGDVEYVKTENDVVYLRMMGACSGCPKSGITLNIQIKQLIQHYFPHIQDVAEYVDPEEEVIPRGH